MVHHGQGLALGFKAGADLFCVHAGLDDLKGHLAPNRSLLFGHIHGAESAFADLFKNFVWADACPKSLRTIHWFRRKWRFEKVSQLILRCQQGIQLLAQGSIARARRIQIRGALFRQGDRRSVRENRFYFFQVH